MNDNEILKDARDLYETEAQWRVDGSTFVRLLCTRRSGFILYCNSLNFPFFSIIKVMHN